MGLNPVWVWFGRRVLEVEHFWIAEVGLDRNAIVKPWYAISERSKDFGECSD